MSISKNNLSKLGLGGSLQVNEETQFVDDNVITHKDLKNSKLDIINIGTLRDPSPVAVIKQRIDGADNSSNYKIYYIPISSEGFYSEYNLNYPLMGQVSYFFADEKKYSVLNNDYYKSIVNEKDLKESFFYEDKAYCRFVFPSGSHNSTSLTGVFTNSTGKSTSFINSKNNKFSGKAYQNSFNYKAWASGNTSGYNTTNYNGYYIPYPTTLNSYNYNAYAIPLKLATSYTDTFLISDSNNIVSGELPVKGIIMISTGNGIKSKICYISSHGLNTGYRDAFIYGSDRTVNSFTNLTGYKKIASGCSIKALVLGSEYFSGNVFSGSGIVFADQISTGYTGEVHNSFKIDQNQHIKQDLPIKDTLFYKFYSGLYTGSKTFNTGVWNGIIPTGTNVQIELITTELNKRIGTNYPIYFVYTGYGTNDATDIKCTKYLNASVSATGVKFLETNILLEGSQLKVKGRAYGIDQDDAWIKAQKDAFYNIVSKTSTILKKYVPEFIKVNYKYKKLQKFITKYRS
jgi:hypothetical protein